MKSNKLEWLVGYTILAIILSSCNLGATPAPTQDIGAIQTQAFNQVLTQVALASSPTPMPTNTAPPATVTPLVPPTFAPVGGGTVFPFNTPLPGLTPVALSSPVATVPAGLVPTKNGCNDGVFTGESAPYDNEIIRASYAYDKNFTYVNTGTCTWDEGYAFVFMPSFSDPDFVGYDILIKKPEDFVKPQKSITFTLKLRASVKPGVHLGAWKLRDDGGNYFGTMVHIKYVIGTRADVLATADSASLTATKAAK